jgi:hypothetical protein
MVGLCRDTTRWRVTVEIISRARWGARYARGFRSAPLPASEIWLHHSVTIAPDLVWVDADGDGVEDDEERAMRTLEDIGQQRFGGGISYTFAVMPSGRTYEGHGVDRQGAHTGGRNDFARAIVLVGDYSTRSPTEAQNTSVAWLVQHGYAMRWWSRTTLNGGHRNAPGASTACPGDKAYAAIPAINRLALSGPIGGFLMALSDNEQKWLYEAIGECWSESGRLGTPVSLGKAMARVHHWLSCLPEADRTGALANAILSTNGQVFYDQDADPATPADTSPTYGPSINSRLAKIEGLLAQLLDGGSGA